MSADNYRCPVCDHTANHHIRWVDWDGEDVACAGDDWTCDCTYTCDYIVWLAAGRPICRDCLHPSYCHEDEDRCSAYAQNDYEHVDVCNCPRSDNMIRMDYAVERKGTPPPSE